MTLGRNAFFLTLLFICITPFIIWKLVWLSKTSVTNGKVWFTGHTIELDGSISSHLVILFLTGKDSIKFEAPASLQLKEGQPVSVRYEKANPTTARLDLPLRIWGDTIVYSLWPLIVLIVIYLIPDSMDPLFPRKSKLRVSKQNLFEIIPA